MMDERSAALYAQLKPFRALVAKTEGFIRWSLARVNNPYVACSFGKDSSVMLHLMLKQNPDIPIVFVRRIETELIDNYSEIINQWGKLNLRMISYRGWLEEDTEGKGISFATRNINEFDSYFVGIRSDESVARRISLRKHGIFFKHSSGKIRISPLSDWSTNDIAVYCIANKLPVLNKYLKEGFDARTTAAIPSKFPHESISSLKRRDIQSYNKLLTLLPDAKYYI